VLLDAADLSVEETIVGGKSYFRRDHAKAA